MMASNKPRTCWVIGCLLSPLFFFSLAWEPSGNGAPHFPYKEAGLSEQDAAAHLLSRFTYGATPGQVQYVVEQGLGNWFMAQLQGELPDDSLRPMLGQYDAMALSNTEIVAMFPRPGQLTRKAIKAGYIHSDSAGSGNRKMYRHAIQRYLEDEGLRPQQELFRQFINQKILRAAYSENQLREVMTTFWFNHFNVSLSKNTCAPFVPNYERDIIRPMSLGKFNDLLLATAKSPAMLYYLDNVNSSAERNTNNNPKGADNPRPKGGINENYAREVMELHTLGVEGGYSQKDVSEAARILTGWTVFRQGQDAMVRKLSDRTGAAGLQKRGFVRDGDFLFAANRHDKGVKVVLGKKFGPNGGYAEGVKLLNTLAAHPSTAHFICHKLAVRLVCDTPSKMLVDRLAGVFLKHDGDIREVLLALVSSPEFWKEDAVHEKIKSPFEVAISAVRSLDAKITQPYGLFNWINKMGERFYYYQAPTGFPDQGQFWINTASLLSRMNFGMAIAAGQIPGVQVDLEALNRDREPESAVQALSVYSALLLPGEDAAATVERLKPQLNDPKNRAPVLAQVTGLILGSPAYQRR